MNDRVVLQFGEFTLDVSERLLTRDGHPVALTPKAFDLLAALAARPGRLVTKDELLKEVWPDSFVEESNLAYHVFALRRALGESAEGESYVETVPKSGYRFVSPVRLANGNGTSPALSNGANGVNPATKLVPDAGLITPGNLDPAAGRKTPSSYFSRAAALWFAAGACSALAVTLLMSRKPPPATPDPVKVEVSTGVRLTETSAFALSPDGRRLVFAGSGADGVVRLWVRDLGESQARPLPGTEVALGGLVLPVFWSPDSRFVAFDSIGQLKKVDVSGGAPQTICTLPGLAVGGSWNQDGVIIVGSPQAGIYRCPSSGGTASIVTIPDASRQQSAHVFPWFLPGGRRFLYLSVSRGTPENSGIFVHSLEAPAATGSSKRILAAAFGSAFVESGEGEEGHLLFMRDGTLFAHAFDPATLEIGGEATRIAGPVGHFLDGAFLSASTSGALAFRSPDETLQLTWLDRSGNVSARVGEPGRYSGMALSPDGKRAVLVQRVTRTNADQDLWFMDLPSGRSSRITFDARLEERPIWSADGKQVVFTTGGSIGSLFVQSVGGEQAARLLLESPHHKIPTSISQDGRFLLYTSETIGPTRGDLWVLSLASGGKSWPLVQRPFDQEQARFSPDGRWIAYVSNESGRHEILVRPFDAAVAEGRESSTESIMVSNAGGTAPRWRADSKELFFVTPSGAIASVPVNTHPTLKFGSPLTLFRTRGVAPDWDVSADGRRFFVMIPGAGDAPASISLIFNWQAIISHRR